MHFKIDWASLIVGSKFTFFALFYFVFEGNCQVQAPGGRIFLVGDFTEGFLRYEFGGLIFRGAYTWRGLFSEFYCIRRRDSGQVAQKAGTTHQKCVKVHYGLFLGMSFS